MAPGALLRFVAAVAAAAALLYADLGQRAFGNLRGEMAAVLAPFRAAADFPELAVGTVADYLGDRRKLLAERDGLEGEIREMQTRARSLDFFADQNDAFRAALNLRRRLKGEWIAAEVVSDGRRPFAGKISLSRGRDGGVLPGMIAVSQEGVVGQVARVEADASVVNLITSGDQWIACRVKRTGELAIVRGAGDGRELAIEFMRKDADLRVGDELAADGEAFPPGYPVARVVSVDRPAGALYLQSRASPTARLAAARVLLIYAAGESEGE